jgi:hypothetical protein
MKVIVLTAGLLTVCFITALAQDSNNQNGRSTSKAAVSTTLSITDSTPPLDLARAAFQA